MTDFSDHYSRLEPLYAELGETGGYYCAGNHDFVGWYNERAGRGRAYCLAKEYPAIRDELDRVMYATATYSSKQWFLDAWTGYEWVDDETGNRNREWHGNTPTPGYSDIRSYSPFADIDLADAVKQNRPAGDIPQEQIESALEQYISAFADLAGDMEHVYALDSVGGAYLFVAPTATTPLADATEAESRELLFEDMMDRLNDWLHGVNEDVIAEHPDLAGVFEADCLNNKNRLYKAPMSVHSSLDGIVTPLDTEAPSYTFTPRTAATEATIAEAKEWTDSFTDDHSEGVCSLVATLWPDYHQEATDWKEAIQARISDLREEAETHAEQEQQRIEADAIPDGLEATADIEVVNATIEAIDVRDVARDVADEWDTAPGRSPKRFDPSWRQSKSGESCYADRDKFVDLKEGKHGGGALKLVARADRDISVHHCRESVSGEDYWKAVAKLREMGYEIPRFKGKDGHHPDYHGLYDSTDDTEEQTKQMLKALRL